MRPKPTPERILADPCTSYWLQDATRALLRRDCVDAARDAELLATMFRERAERLLAMLEP